jgi:hypothetical protein
MNVPSAVKETPDEGSLSIDAHRLTRTYTVGSVQVTGIDGIDLAVSSGQFDGAQRRQRFREKAPCCPCWPGWTGSASGELTVAGRMT